MIYFLTVNYYCSEYIASLISSIHASRGVAYKIAIVNNSIDDDSIHDLKADNVEILSAESNLGFGQACNLGLKWICDRDSQAIVWIINPDTQLLPDALEKVPPFFAAHPELSLVGTIVYTPTDEIWFAGGQFNPETGEITAKTIYNDRADLLDTDWISGCSLLINLKKFQDTPQFDPAYFLYYEDFDFCRRYADRGHLIAIAPQIGVIHQPSAITGKNIHSKYKHSTYSYLLSLERYSQKRWLTFRLTRLILHAIALIPLKPKIAFGKLHGIWLYSHSLCAPLRLPPRPLR